MTIKQIKSTVWYRQQTEGTPYFIYLPCRGCVEWFKSRSKIIWFCNLEEARAYLSQDHIRDLAIQYLSKEKRYPGSMLKLYRRWLKNIAQKNNHLYKKISRVNLSNLTNNELLKLNYALAKQCYAMWTHFFMDIYDVDAESLIEKELVNNGITLTADEKDTMMLQHKLIVHQQAERDLLQIIKLIKHTPGVSNVFWHINSPANLHRLTLYPVVAKAVSNYQQKYFWMRNSWAYASVLTEFDIVDLIKQMLFGSRNLAAELNKLLRYERDTKKRQFKIARKYNMSSWLRHVFDFFSLLAIWRDDRKAVMQQLNHYLEKVGREIARRSGLTWQDIKVCDPLALEQIPVKRSLVNKYHQLLKNQYLLIWSGHQVVHLSKSQSAKIGKALETTFNTKMTEIRGMIACPGRVKAQVVVINKKSEFSKMQPGKVLVTTMTRPESVPLMKKAVAIVTDEGGITSHAAIVSRELKIPCIIGTQVASKVLRDGDLVEVNANHGVVTVLKRK